MQSTSANEHRPSVPSCYSIEKLNFMYTEVGGLTEMNLDNSDFKATFGIDWVANEMKNEVVSEIFIEFLGKRIIIINVSIMTRHYFTLKDF